MDWLFWLANGLLAVLYLLAEHLGAALTIAAFGLLWGVTRRAEFRPWLIGAGALAFAAALFAPAPVPLILPAMAWAGWLRVRLEHFNPDSLLWRVLGGVALYALTALGLTAYAQYAAAVEAESWAASFATGAAGQLFANGQPYLATAATLALWLVGPGAYFSLLLKELFIHAPHAQTPAALTTAIRTGQAAKRKP